MNNQLEQISNLWPAIKTVFSVPHTNDEYQTLVKVLDSMIDEIGNNENHELAPVMETIGNLIENYENREHSVNESSPVEALKYLMEEHELKQSDLKEIGSQGVVSEIITGKRILNLEQIKKLSKRFHVSPLVFI